MMKSATLSLLLCSTLVAQVYTPPTPAAPSANAPTNTTIVQQPGAPAKNPLGEEIPLLDPSAETLKVGGVTIPIGDNRIMKARFEKYLSQPADQSEEFSKYRQILDQTLELISPFHPGGANLREAFGKLPRAAAYPGDAGICNTLAEAIMNAMLSKQDTAGLTIINESLEKERALIMKDGDWKARHDRETELVPGKEQPQGNRGGKGGGGRSSPSNSNPAGYGQNSLEYKNTVKRMAEIEVMKRSNTARSEIRTVQTKTQYQVNMIQWFMQRRYEHVLLAARFYNQIWKDGDVSLRIRRDSDVSKLFSDSLGVSPTVSSLDSIANECIREVTQYISAIQAMLDNRQLHTATQRMMEAYAIGEYMGPVTTFPIEKKRLIYAYYQKLNELYGAMQAHDYTLARSLSKKLHEAAVDYPGSKIDSAIAGYTLASDLAIEEGKKFLLEKNSQQASLKIREATELWPMNPKLDEIKTFISSAGPVVQAKNDFDRLLSEGNYREIVKRQYEIAPAIQGDAKREDAFKQVITNLMKIESAIGKANEFSKMGQNYAAYEQLATLRNSFPDDPKLGREIELLAPKVADFTKALDQAARLEKSEQIGSALSWYLKARSIYQNSDMASASIQRLTERVLGENSRKAE